MINYGFTNHYWPSHVLVDDYWHVIIGFDHGGTRNPNETKP